MLRKLSILSTMPKKISANKKVSTSSSEIESKTNDCVYTDKKGNIMIKVSAKPGSKNSELTGISEEGVGVRIGAPPVDGEANAELIKYFAGVLNVRKSDLCLDRGSKSRQKTLQLAPGIISVEQVMEKLKNAMDK